MSNWHIDIELAILNRGLSAERIDIDHKFYRFLTKSIGFNIDDYRKEFECHDSLIFTKNVNVLSLAIRYLGKINICLPPAKKYQILLQIRKNTVCI